MALESGTHLAHYEIVSELGRGGMGEVYRARDTKLGREVAIKVLPTEFAQDAERLARFDREARMLAALNHPNIAAIHGLEESGDTRFLVLELVEGETLADVIKRGPVPVAESLALAVQIADALGAAHQKGVIHRDLKPANVKVTPDGRVKVLDFGLAKAFIGDQADVNLSHSPTLSMAATQQGVVLGTAGYMAPEQASGEVADHRADIWAFGVVLFEMLSGRGLFTGKTVTHVLASVMKEEPDWSALPPNLHPRVRFLLERCLEKEPADRCQAIGEARAELRKASTEDATAQAGMVQRAPVPERSPVTTLAWGAAIVLSCLATGLVVWTQRPAELVRVQRFDYNVPETQQFRNPGRNLVAFAPDASHFVYNTSAGFMIRSMNEFDARLIPGTEAASAAPFFSPDGQNIGFYDFANGELRRIAIQGGTAVRIAVADNPFGASWSDDGTILYGQVDGIWRVPATGGEPTRVIEAAPGQAVDGPELLPGGDWVLYTTTEAGAAGQDRWNQGTIVAGSLSSGEQVTIWEGGSDARYLPTGHIVYALDNDLYGLAFDLASMTTSGGPVPLIEGVQRAGNPVGNTASANYAVSDAGDLIYLEAFFAVGDSDALTTLVWQDRDGREAPLALPVDGYFGARFSPDGTRAAVVIGDAPGETDLWILDIATSSLRQLTFNGGGFPVWRDEGTILFQSPADDQVYSVSAEGGMPVLVGGSEEFGSLPWSVTPDGGTLALAAVTTATDIGIGLLDIDGGALELLPITDADITNEPALSPDGEWIAFFQATVERTVATLNIRPFPEIERGRFEVPVEFARHPLWSPDGSEIFFYSNNGVWSLPVSYEPVFNFGAPTELFSGNYWWGFILANGGGGRAWDYHPASDRFLVPRIAASEATGEEITPRIRIVLNWLDEVKDRVPVD